MKKLLLLSMLLLLTFEIYSQEDYKNESIRVKINPLTMIDYTPRLRLGLEYFSNKKLGYSIDLGIGNYFLNKGRLEGLIWGKDYSFFEIRQEIKYALKRNKYYTFYCATEFFYLKLTDRLQSGHYQKENSNNVIEYESATHIKQKTGVHIKTGVALNLLKRFDIDIYGGMGIAERKINYTNVVNPLEGEGRIFVEWVPQNYLFEGKSTIFHLTMGFKIGYLLWRKAS